MAASGWVVEADSSTHRCWNPFVSQRLVGFGVKHNSDDLSALRALIEAGEVTPVVGETYQLSEVPDAMRDLKAGTGRGGKTVIAVREPRDAQGADHPPISNT